MIAQVLVDVKAKSVDQTFDYLVPTHLEQVLEIGQRIIVPFGPRFVMGYIISFSDYSSFKSLKKIKELLDIEVVLTSELIELGKDLQKTTTAPLISIYQAMLPTALKGKYQKKLTLLDHDSIHPDLQEFFKTSNEIIWNTKLDALAYQIKKAIDSKHIKLEYLVNQRGHELFIKRIKFLHEGDVRGSKQRVVLDYLNIHQDVLKQKLINDLNVNLTTIKTLVQKGYIEEYLVETYREIESLFKPVDKNITLFKEQEDALQEIIHHLDEETVFLLHGVTGSGKTEIYLNVIEEVIKRGKEAILLVPEISLTPMMVSRFKGRFQDQVALLHSGLNVGEKYDEWRKIKRKEVQVVVGARSAIFAPFENLGVIIIDEEHTDSYKQDDIFSYHAKDVAIRRAKTYNIPVVLGSATPSVESFYKAKHSEYHLLTLQNRANQMKLPQVHVIDMKQEFKQGNRSIFSEKLHDLLQEKLEKKEQSLLLLNRRGHSTFVMCRDCGEVIMCPNCDISLTYHENNDELMCHYCGHKESNPSLCPNCFSKNIRYMGIGTQKVEEKIKEIFPNARVVRMDKDTTSKKNAHEALLFEFEHEGDILLGTQMIAKGLDFKKVTLVGVLAADMSLNLPDYKAIERTFQLLTQVSGRAGRHDLEGEVVIQTYNPDHYAIKFAKDHDYHKFYETEMQIREIAQYSPVINVTQIIVSDKDVSYTLKQGTKIVQFLRRLLGNEVMILGPVLPKIARIANYYRAQIIVKHHQNIDEQLQKTYEAFNEVISLSIDHNPTLL